MKDKPIVFVNLITNKQGIDGFFVERHQTYFWCDIGIAKYKPNKKKGPQNG